MAESETQDVAVRIGHEPVIDLPGIAELLGVAATTPQQWRQRGQLPEPDVPTYPEQFTDKPLWFKSTIVRWAEETDRWPPGRVARPRGR